MRAATVGQLGQGPHGVYLDITGCPVRGLGSYIIGQCGDQPIAETPKPNWENNE
jgi:hypothetical protein